MFGTIINGVFIGTIEIANDGRYYIEAAKRYLNNSDAHSIIYHENEIELNDDLKEATKHINKMLKDSGTDDYYYDSEQDSNDSGLNCALNDKKIKEKIDAEQTNHFKSIHDNEDLMFKYTKEANDKHSKVRSKRQATPNGRLTFPNSLSACNLYLIADPFFYNTIFAKEGQKVIFLLNFSYLFI